jgi:uncharacterized protein
MIVYLDASALVKRYFAERGSGEVAALLAEAEAIGTCLVTRVEVIAAFAKAVRVRLVSRQSASAAVEAFNPDWADLMRLQVSEPLAVRAATLAWEHGLRGYDAVHLAAALVWQESIGSAVTMATFDRELWKSASATGLIPWPQRAP